MARRMRRSLHHQSCRTRIRSPQSPRPESSKLLALDPLLGLFVPALTLVSSYDNFHVTLLDAYRAYQEVSTGAIAVLICVPYMLVKSFEFLAALPKFNSWIRFPTCRPKVRIYRDTAVVVIISYVLLLDISLSYICLAIFPAIAIAFIYALCVELTADHASGSSTSPSSSTNDHDDGTATNAEGSSPEMALVAIAALPFWVLLVMAQLDQDAADRFAVSQFLLFLSSTLGALTRMMTRLPAGAASPGIAPASELLHKTLLLLLLATAHTVAAESLGEDVVLICLPEAVPMLLWFSLHLDRGSSVISVDKLKPRRNALIAVAVVVAPLLAYLATSMEETGLSRCSTILVSCGVSASLTYYVVFMLRHWPGQQASAGSDATADTLKIWANFLLTAAAALLLLKYLCSVRLGLQEPPVTTVCRNLRMLCSQQLSA